MAGFDEWDELMYRFTVPRYEKCACNNIYNIPVLRLELLLDARSCNS